MSSQRGNCAKSGSQKHQNTKAYRNDLHRKDKSIKMLNSRQITGCCKRCKEVIEWKIKYNKYKPLTNPKKCVKCLQKSITNSYFIICTSCIESQNLCGKCALVPPTESSAEAPNAVESEISSKSKTTSAKPKPDDENDESDYDEDDSDLNKDVEQALTIKAKNQVSVKPNEVQAIGNSKRKNAKTPKASDKRNVNFEANESSDESERDGEEEKVASGCKEKTTDDKTASADNERDDEDKDKLDKDIDQLHEDEDGDVNKSSVNVRKDEDNQSELDEDDGEDYDDDDEDADDEDD